MQKTNSLNANDLLKGRQWVIYAFESGIFPTHSRALPSSSNDDFDSTLTLEPQSTSLPMKSTKANRFKLLAPKQLLQKLTILLAQVKAGNNSENLLNETKFKTLLIASNINNFRKIM